MTDPELRVSKIEDGTVIDHISGGQALNVLAILGIDGSGGVAVSVGINVPSDRLGVKDIVKVEGRELSQNEVDVLSLIAPAASIRYSPATWRYSFSSGNRSRWIRVT